MDIEKVLTMIIIYEYGEVEVSDSIPNDGISKKKNEIELEEIKKIK